MVPLSITLDAGKGVTVLSNVFIDQYMRDANDAQIKIYLYILRMVGAHLPTNISEIADKFNHTEKDVIRALKHWESVHLISLSYDENNEINGITIRDLTKNENTVVKTAPLQDSEKDDIPMISMDYRSEKENYSLEDIKKLQSNPEVSLLLNVAAQYFGRPLSPTEIRSILFIYDRLDFSLELTDFLIEYCLDKNKKSIHYIEQVAINWYEAGIKTVAAAKDFVKDTKADKTAYTIMKYLGKSSDPTLQELEYIRKWLNVYCFSLSIIEEACSRTVLATDKNRFQYAESILKSWKQKNVKDKNDIAKLDSAFESNRYGKNDFDDKAKSSIANSSNKAIKNNYINNSGNKDYNNSFNNSFNNIEEQEYDFEALENASKRKAFASNN